LLFKNRQRSSSIFSIAAVMVAYTLTTATLTLAQTKTAALPPAGGAASAGAPGSAAAPASSGPIDIQADSQDFAGDVVFAKGHVKVLFKDSTVYADDAQLFKDPQGQPQMAIFTGNPHLLQKGNKIDADKLTFMMAVNKIIAEGNAHSEVSGDADEVPGGETSKIATTPPPVAAPAAAPAPAKKKGDAGGWQDDEAEAPAAAPVVAAAPADAPAKPAEKIFVNSDHQEYESESGHFVAMGHCKVKHGEIKVDSDNLNLVYGADGKPETALFGGTVTANQNGNTTKAEHMTYSLVTQRLQASGNVRSKVIQQKPATSELKKGALTSQEKKSDVKIKVKKADGTIKELSKEEADKFGIVDEGEKKKSKTFELVMDSDEPIYIVSDSQDYIKENGRMTALGNVHVYYNDNKGLGHKMVMTRNNEGKADKMIFTGRSQIVQPGKRWIGDKITFLVPTERVISEGNTKAIILNTTAQVKPKVDAGATDDATADSSTNSQVDAQVVKEPDSKDPKMEHNEQIGATEDTSAQ
jgi:lipopolysaccharide export system protein LptA